MLLFSTKIPHRIRGAVKESLIAAYKDCIASEWALGEPDIEVRWNRRLKTTAGRVRRETEDGLSWTIELNPKYFEEWGEERILGTFRHELAHIADYLDTGRIGHGKSFRRYCRAFQGTMNTKLARDHQECATTAYLRTPEKWQYTCPDCGANFQRKRRVTGRLAAHGVCNRCYTPFKEFLVKQLR